MEQLSTAADVNSCIESPARATLSRAIRALGEAHDRLAETAEPLAKLEMIAARSAEAAELHNKIVRLRAAESEIFGGPSEGDFLPGEFSDAAGRLGRLAGCAADAEQEILRAREAHNAASERLRGALTEREDALWPVAVETAMPEFSRLEDAIRRVLGIEARLRSLILALREAGHRDEPRARGALSAAYKIEVMLRDTRGKPEERVDLGIGRCLLTRLRSDPDAVL